MDRDNPHDRVSCPTCGEQVSRVTHTIGEVTFAEPCTCPVAYQLSEDGTVRLHAVDDAPTVFNPRVLIADVRYEELVDDESAVARAA